jgi:hypothetical protein
LRDFLSSNLAATGVPGLVEAGILWNCNEFYLFVGNFFITVYCQDGMILECRVPVLAKENRMINQLMMENKRDLRYHTQG